MAVQQNDTIVKSEVVSIFKTNLLAAMYSGAKGSNNMPKFTQSAGGITTAAGTSRVWTTPNAIDAGQLDPTSYPSVSIPNTIVTAADTYNALKTIVDNLTKIRYYTSNWYYQQNDTLSLVETQSGTAVFKATIPALTAYSSATKTDGYSGWNRVIEGQGQTVTQSAKLTVTLSVTNPFVQNNQAKANQVQPYTLNNTLFKRLFDAWAVYRNKRITYTYYTCHSNCHSNWVNSRSRR